MLDQPASISLSSLSSSPSLSLFFSSSLLAFVRPLFLVRGIHLFAHRAVPGRETAGARAGYGANSEVQAPERSHCLFWLPLDAGILRG